MRIARKSNVGASIFFAILQMVLSAGVAIVFGVLALGSVVIRAGMSGFLFLAGATWTILLFGNALQTLIVMERCRRIVRKAEKYGDRVGIQTLAELMGTTTDKLLNDLGVMAARGYYPYLQLDLLRQEVAIDNAQPGIKPQGDTILKTKTCRSRWAFLLFFAVFFTIVGISPITTTTMIIALVFSSMVFVIGYVFMPKTIRYVETPFLLPKTQPISTGNSDLDSMLNTAAQHFDQLAVLDRKITDPKIDSKVEKMTKTAWEIVNHLKEHPEKVRQARQFMNYYLPTTVKLLTEHTNFASQPVHSENMVRSMQKIEEMLDTIVDAFQRELDNLYVDKAVDISAEIDVMKGMLHREGLGSLDITKSKA